MSATSEVLQQARRAYDIATDSWHHQNRIGGIVRLDPNVPEDSDEMAKGARWKCATPAGAKVMGIWQKCKAELDAAHAVRQRALGNNECPVCPRKEGEDVPRRLPEPDRRLPPEADDVIS